MANGCYSPSSGSKLRKPITKTIHQIVEPCRFSATYLTGCGPTLTAAVHKVIKHGVIAVVRDGRHVEFKILAVSHKLL